MKGPKALSMYRQADIEEFLAGEWSRALNHGCKIVQVKLGAEQHKSISYRSATPHKGPHLHLYCKSEVIAQIQ